jgi:hypothetical protein
MRTIIVEIIAIVTAAGCIWIANQLQQVEPMRLALDRNTEAVVQMSETLQQLQRFMITAEAAHRNFLTKEEYLQDKLRRINHVQGQDESVGNSRVVQGDSDREQEFRYNDNKRGS